MDAKEESYLVDKYQYLAYRVADKCARAAKRCGCDTDDLVQEAMVGIVNGIRRYDPNRGVAMSTYLWSLAYGEILHYLRDHTHFVSLSKYASEACVRIFNFKEHYYDKYGVYPDDAQIMESCHISETIYEAINALPERQEIPQDREDDWRGLECVESFEEASINRLICEHAMSSLDDTEFYVVVHCYFYQETYPEVAKALGLSTSRVGSIRAAAMRKMRKQLRTRIKEETCQRPRKASLQTSN